MTEKDFEILIALSETGNITRASERLFITQSALSKKVRSIERELGAELFIRSRRGIRFTPAGEAALSHSLSAFREMEKMRRELTSMRDAVCGTLKAGFSINFAQYRLPNVLAEYHRRYPLVELNVTTGHSRTMYRLMVEGALDFAVVRGDYAWDDGQFLLSREHICVARGRDAEGAPLSRLRYINHKSDPALELLQMRWLREQGLGDMREQFFVDNIGTCAEMVRRGLGWALIPEIALSGFDGLISPCVFKDGEPLCRSTRVLCQNASLRLPQVDAFVRLLRGR